MRARSSRAWAKIVETFSSKIDPNRTRRQPSFSHHTGQKQHGERRGAQNRTRYARDPFQEVMAGGNPSHESTRIAWTEDRRPARMALSQADITSFNASYGAQTTLSACPAAQHALMIPPYTISFGSICSRRIAASSSKA